MNLYCSITYDTSYRYSGLSVSTSSPPLRVTNLIGDGSDIGLGKISYSSVSIYTEILRQVIFADASGNKLHFIKQISATQFLTNFGVYTIGAQTKMSSFTFTYESYQSDTPPITPPFNPPALPTSGVAAYLYPVLGMEVTDSSKSFIYSYEEVGVLFFGKNAQTDFKGINLYNPLYGMRDLAFYPPYDPVNNNDGTIVFQTVEGSEYRGFPCEYDSSGSFEFYDFEVSLSDVLDSFPSFFSISLSLDEFDSQDSRAKQSADNMAFSLF